MASMVKGVKRMVIGFIVTLLLIVVGIAGYTAYQSININKKLHSFNNKCMIELKRLKKLSTVSQDQINSKSSCCRIVIMQNELDKYKTETYYNLDKAIIANDPKQAK